MRAHLQGIADALVAFGPWGVFLLAIIDSMGVPLPAAIDVLLIGVAASSAHSPQTAYFTALLAVVGSVGGNLTLFLAARQGRKLFTKEVTTPGKPQRFREWFRRYGLLTVFVPAVVPLVPLPLKVFVISAGCFHTPLQKFAILILVARVIRYFGLAYLGLQLGLDTHGFLVRNGWKLTGVALAMMFAIYFLMRMADRRRSEIHN